MNTKKHERPELKALQFVLTERLRQDYIWGEDDYSHGEFNEIMSKQIGQLDAACDSKDRKLCIRQATQIAAVALKNLEGIMRDTTVEDQLQIIL